MLSLLKSYLDGIYRIVVDQLCGDYVEIFDCRTARSVCELKVPYSIIMLTGILIRPLEEKTGYWVELRPPISQ